MHSINEMRLTHFQGGGLVSAMSAPLIASSVAHDVSTTTTGAPTGRPLVLNIGGESISGLTANETAATAIARLAVSRAVRSGGVKPSWYSAT
jgi:hypothetical protein